MKSIHQSPREPKFVQNPYDFYDRARENGPVLFWDDYRMPALFSHQSVMQALKHPDLARVPNGGLPPYPDHMAAFAKVEHLSLLSLEGPLHKRLRGRVLRAFTTGRIKGLAPQISELCHNLIDQFPSTPFDLMQAYCQEVPVIVIARLLGVDDNERAQLLRWSHDMVGVYQTRADKDVERKADIAAAAFSDWLRGVIAQKRQYPDDGLLSALCAATGQDQLSEDEIIATTILLLNAGHEATVSALGHAVLRLLSTGRATYWTDETRIEASVEECLRIDPPLHVFTRYVLRDTVIDGAELSAGQEVACVLGAANRDPDAYPDPHQFHPGRAGPTLTSFGAGVHFCIGAPLARLEMRIALKALFDRCPNLQLAAPPVLDDTYHFHGYSSLLVSA